MNLLGVMFLLIDFGVDFLLNEPAGNITPPGDLHKTGVMLKYD